MTMWSSRKYALMLVTYVAFVGGVMAHGPTPETQRSSAESGAETDFLRESDAAMDKMMANMEVTPSGDVDRDFVAMMTPHHQGAIDMALAVLKYGKNEQLKRIAQEIIVDQQQEIAVMKLAIGDPLPPSAPAPTQITPLATPSGAMHSMDPNMKM
ncbi:DUF305 domain-containing protein (plasmid) [Rhizobium sp. CC1099]|uniref:DUF305 domain-containing protein n=1 Tax=Rhizobium sp. CC1099 TaxID=3039160 RepID=UPI0024B21F4E|nr:DUF305 domain-containing protein [Rhizobium sp. CC1099]WFU91412.1 DUF305 domain-containing protein [Rhizobium sp. CC1099]